MNTEKVASPKTQTSIENVAENRVIPPSVDVFENENELLVVADMPGVPQENMTINFDKGRLTISGRRKPKALSPRVRETENGDFRRTFLVPQGIDAERIAAELSVGVLQVHLPKHASAKPRRIEVKAP